MHVHLNACPCETMSKEEGALDDTLDEGASPAHSMHYIVSRPWAWRALRRTAWPSPSCVCYVCVPLGLRAQRLRSGRTPVRDTASYTFEGDGEKNSTTEPQRVRRGYEHGASGAQLSPSGGHRGPSEGGQTWPQIAQLPRSVFTGWAVKFGLGAQLLSETHPLSIPHPVRRPTDRLGRDSRILTHATRVGGLVGG